MVGVKRTVSTAIVALAVASVVHADMMPVYLSEGGSPQPISLCDRTVAEQPSDSNWSATFLDAVALDALTVGLLPAARADAGDGGAAKPLRVLTDRQDSFSLCLYTLMGLGLCRTAPWIKRLCVGCIPDWYHSGGPHQIGHSFAISPDCLSPALSYCFIQPDSVPAAEDSAPQYRGGIIMSVWRKSQFTPSVVASRGPPFLS
jgi:hypothetical protein